MDFFQNINIVLLGFFIWLAIAPRLNSPRYGELFLAYMAALLLCLLATSEIMMSKPVPFFFTVGGSFAFCYIVLRATIRVTIKKKVS